MSKKQVPPDLMDRLAGRTTQTPDKHSTNDTQTTHIHSTSNTLKRYDVRLDPDDWEWLKAHFKTRGLSVSAGLRMIVKEYINSA